MTVQQLRSKGTRESTLWTHGIRALVLLVLTVTISLAGLSDRSNVVELAVYTIKEGKQSSFLKARSKMLSSVSRYRGFLSANTYQSLNNPNLYVDYYVWASYEEALNAEKEIQSDERSRAFLQSVDSLKVYNHSKLIDGGLVGEQRKLLASDIIEIAAYDVPKQNIEAFKRARVPVFNMIRKYSGFKFARTSKSVDSSLFIDYVVMSDLETAHAADKEITPTKEAEAYFALVGQFHFFDRLRLIN